MGALAHQRTGLPTFEEARRLVERVADSERFLKAPRLREFLLYVAQCTLEDRLAEVREQVIAERVFGRKPDVSGQDSIVRAEARNLRKRLEAYFSNEGLAEQTIIVMPKGGYALAFLSRASEEPGTRSDEAALALPGAESGGAQPGDGIALTEVTDITGTVISASQIESPRALAAVPKRANWLLAATLGILMLLFAAGAVYWYTQATALRAEIGVGKVPYPFSAIFNGQQTTIIVTSDTGMLQISSLLHRRISLDEYIARNYGTLPPTNPPDLLQNWNIYEFTDGREMAIANLFVRQNARFARRISMLSGHSVQMQDFKANSAVLIGSPISNPWAQLYEENLNFRCDLASDGRIVYRNRRPRASEPDRFPSEDDIQHHRTYARLAFLPATDSAAATMLIAGTTAQATQSAGELMADPVWLSRSLRDIGIDPSGPPHFFECLIRLDNFVGGAISPEVAAWRLTPAPEH